MGKPRSSPRGFTLVEMLVVLLIITVLAAVIVPVAMTYSRGSGVRDAARTVQAALAGARDRALSDQQARGVRLLVDQSNPDYVRSLQYIRQLDPLSGTCHILRADHPSDPQLPLTPDLQDASTTVADLVIAGPGVAFPPGPGMIRFGLAGQLYSYVQIDRRHLRIVGPAYPPSAVWRATEPVVNLMDQNDFDTHLQETEGIYFTIPRGAAPMEDAELLPLPAGVVIDVGRLTKVVDAGGGIEETQSRARWGLSHLLMPDLPLSWSVGDTPIPVPYYDIMFSPNGQVTGRQIPYATPTLGIWIREELADVETTLMLDAGGSVVTDPIDGQDIEMLAIRTTSQASAHAIVTVHGRTGAVAAVPPHFVPDPRPANNGFYDPREYFRNVLRNVDSGL